MAYLSRFSDVIKPVIAGADLVEGTAVKIIASGGDQTQLPKVIAATPGEVHNVYVVMAAQDDFSRPTEEGMYTADWKKVLPYTTGYGNPVHTRTTYDIAKSLLWSPTIKSGERTQAHRGTTVAVPSDCYVDSAGIKVPGARIKVGSAGLWEVTSTESETVGTVDEYNPVNAVLIFTLEQ